MKTKSLFMAVAALAIAGCSQNEVMEMNPDTHRAIGLDVYTGVHTKGAETTTSTIQGENVGFGIFAYLTTGTWNDKKTETKPEFMYNEHATWATDSWSYTSSPRFWPLNDDQITFFAYAPYEDQTAESKKNGITLSAQTDEGAPKITFEVKTSNDWKDMVDLVVDTRNDIKNQTSESNKSKAGTVSFKFSHVLTKIANVKVKPSTDLGENTKIFVRELKLVPGEILCNKAVYDLGTDKWGDTEPVSHFNKDIDLSSFLNRTVQTEKWGYTENSIDVSDNATAASLFKSGEALYFIPVDNSTGTAALGNLKLKITYDIVTKVGDGSSHLVSKVTEREVELPANTFKKGTAHTYVLTIKMNTIMIAVEDKMADWIANKDEEINVEKDTDPKSAN